MGFGFIISGFVLLFNPVINVFDIIPDAIGFLLIAIGLNKLSFFVDDIARSRKMFVNLVYVELLKIASMYFVVMSPNIERGSLKVLFAFVFGLAEAMMFTFAVIKLFDGLAMSGVKYSGSRMTDPSGNNGKSADRSGKTRRFIIFFYIFRCVATLLPELTELEMYDRVGNVSAFSRPLADYKSYFYIICAVPVIVLGIVLVVKTCRYFRFISKDEAYRESFTERYAEAQITRPTLFLSRRMMSALALFVAATLTSFTLILSDVNVLIGAISALFFASSAAVMHKYVKKSYIIFPLALCRCVSSVFAFVLQVGYFDKYSTEAVEWVDKAETQYMRMAIVSLVDALVGAVLFGVFVAVLLGAIRDHLKVCGSDYESAQYSKANRDRETFKALKVRLLSDLVIGCLYFASVGAYRYIVLSFPEYIVIHTAISIVFTAYSIYAVSAVNELLYGKEAEIA